MSSADFTLEQCRHYAKAALLHAEATEDDKTRRAWLNLAGEWMNAAGRIRREMSPTNVTQLKPRAS